MKWLKIRDRSYYHWAMAGISYSRWRRRAVAWLRYALSAGRLGRFVGYTARRFLTDGCPLQAAGLSYVSLLAIVPLFAIGLAVLAGVPAFESWRGDVQAFVLRTLVPEAGAEASAQLAIFVENASRMTGPGLVFLALAAILLMANVNGALNTVWRVAEPRPLALRLAVYWAVLTLGPVLIGASLSLSGYAFAAVEWFGAGPIGDGLLDLSWLLSFALAVLGFALLYFVVPNRAVRPWHALAGGLVAALLFELLKTGFGLFLTHFPSYEVIYGALAAIPVFLVWMYLAWTAALFGAEVAAAMPEWRAARARGRVVAGPGARLALALSLLARLQAASGKGVKPRERRLGQGLPATPGEIDTTLRHLRRAGYVARGLGGRWLLARDLDTVTIADLAEVLDLGFAPGVDWEPAARAAVEDLAAATEAPMRHSLGALLAEPPGQEECREP
jgi:membrane protein